MKKNYHKSSPNKGSEFVRPPERQAAARLAGHSGLALCATRMKIDKSHHVDKSEPDADGMYEYSCGYHIYEFSEGNLKLVARSYNNEPESHFLRLEEKGNKVPFSKKSLNELLVQQAIHYLKKEGINSISYLDESMGYVKI